ncbi:hypothetical protein L226DRAFT_522069 [Lentinus tigrinus ALCF2SS1-7]|uniref:Uncharacterized protein n=1 Tax=Lentinus tigrinus ALCF2SS1-6 TaxID=1328759 RepID=A0A5C2SMC8_9APHY|nr:hypothetical protein L227DRAFT_560987 [Lentinus tigrinus ALCF2SS1-6]RPD76488.1 hypothetical protein L226DRAFT_522069 [Lentinus tigrinus ALCF2SS1-7]
MCDVAGMEEWVGTVRHSKSHGLDIVSLCFKPVEDVIERVELDVFDIALGVLAWSTRSHSAWKEQRAERSLSVKTGMGATMAAGSLNFGASGATGLLVGDIDNKAKLEDGAAEVTGCEVVATSAMAGVDEGMKEREGAAGFVEEAVGAVKSGKRGGDGQRLQRRCWQSDDAAADHWDVSKAKSGRVGYDVHGSGARRWLGEESGRERELQGHCQWDDTATNGDGLSKGVVIGDWGAHHLLPLLLALTPVSHSIVSCREEERHRTRIVDIDVAVCHSGSLYRKRTLGVGANSGMLEIENMEVEGPWQEKGQRGESRRDGEAILGQAGKNNPPNYPKSTQFVQEVFSGSLWSGAWSATSVKAAAAGGGTSDFDDRDLHE